MLLVDHNVKSVARLVDRVLAMYIGERIAEGTADQVMRNETVRRVYLGGSIETAARPNPRSVIAPRRSSKSKMSVLLRQGAGT